MAFRDDILADVDDIRSIPGEFGVHRYQVWVRKIVHSGTRIGLGSPSTTDTRLLCGGQDPHVREIKSNDVVAGNDSLQAGVFEIGPITPDVVHTMAALDPPQTAQPTEVFYLIKGPGLPSGGLLCMKVSDDAGRPFRYMIRVKSAGRAGA